MASRNDESNIGMRLGKLFRQYGLRIAYAQYNADLYENERQKCSAIGQSYKALQAQIAKQSWEAYRKNLIEKQNEMGEAVQQALIGYSDTQRRIWYAYFLEGKSSTVITKEVNLSDRTVERMIAKMKVDMELKFDGTPFKRAEAEAKAKWDASQLAAYLEGNPSQAYQSAIQDLLDYGAIDLDALEFDQRFQDYLATGRRPADGDR